MSKHALLSKVDELHEVLTDPELDIEMETRMRKFRDLRLDILDRLLNTPGALLHVKDNDEHEKYKSIINVLWKNIDQTELLDEFHGGRFVDNLTNTTGTITSRFMKLRPTFISINPENTEFKTYFEQAMQAWVYGLDQAALILCFSILEDALKDRLRLVDPSYVYELMGSNNAEGVKTVSFGNIIKSAYEEDLISYEQKETLFDIKKKRNDSVHDLVTVDGDEVYNIILQTKDIVEHLLSDSGANN